MASLPDSPVFSLCGGHPVLDLVNTLDFRFRAAGPDELLPSYGALLAFMLQSGLLDHPTRESLAKRALRTEQALQAARELRESAAAVLYATVEGSTPAAAEIRKLEAFALAAHQHQELIWTRGAADSHFVWDWRSSRTEAELPVWILSLQTVALLTSPALKRVHSCHSESCRWLFLDTSKNHTRRWCDMKVCGNRMKAQRFQARRQ
jgi:predicted RNA-binding Zn ribbon-like protein